jgi:hypothetical protein
MQKARGMMEQQQMITAESDIKQRMKLDMQ